MTPAQVYACGSGASVLKGCRRFGLTALILVASATLALPFQSEIYNPTTRNWENYDPNRAMLYYQMYGRTPEQFQRQVVRFRTAEAPGTIVIDADKNFLYFVLPGFEAMRYGIGVGRDGFGWAGIVSVGRKSEWPTWTPPASMIERDPKLAKYTGGMPGGPNNPLGARAIYLYEGGRDTIYRIHGTTEPWSIGLNVSSGCFRMVNDDVEDLYERVRPGAKVIVLMQGAALYSRM